MNDEFAYVMQIPEYHQKRQLLSRTLRIPDSPRERREMGNKPRRILSCKPLGPMSLFSRCAWA